MSDEVYEGAIGIDLGEFVRYLVVCAAGTKICKFTLPEDELVVEDNRSLTRPRYYLLLRCQL